ncbi:nuclear transport factor 2 family protein [Streptomyces sp. MS06]|uniref:nuclear transport factor 2 family protein n=1 Tax=Streptomyces sp. MS06 TaxID=3385974 RepID=UPI00399F2598
MSWTRGVRTALAVCVLLVAGPAGCTTGHAHPGEAESSPSPVGKLLDDTDRQGRRLREVPASEAPEVAVEVQPAAGGAWRVLLTVHRFRFSPPGAPSEAVAGRGTALLLVDDRAVAELHAPTHRLPGGSLPHGTHHVTARLYADDGTAWAVDGEPVQSTADITASEASPAPEAGTEASPAPEAGTEASPAPEAGTGDSPAPEAGTESTSAPEVSTEGVSARTDGRGSKDPGGKAS